MQTYSIHVKRASFVHAILLAMTVDTRDFVLSVGLTAALILFVPEVYLVPLFIVLGQGHFALSYLYQYRAGKVGTRYLVSYIGLSILLLAFILTATAQQAHTWTLLLASVVFGLHFFFDELFMHDDTYTVEQKLFGAGFGIQYVLVASTSVFGLWESIWSTALPFLIVSWALVIPLVITSVRNRRYGVGEIFLLALLAFFSVALFIPIHLSILQILAFTILFHYVRWYLFYAEKLRKAQSPERMRRYIIDSLIVNAVIIVAYMLYRFGFADPLVIVFSETFFYFWTILHVVFSLSFFHHIRPANT